MPAAIWFYFHFPIWRVFYMNTVVHHCCAVAAAARTGPFINEVAVRSVPQGFKGRCTKIAEEIRYELNHPAVA